MKKASVRTLHLDTSNIVKEVEAGERFVIEKRGVAVAELRPIESLPEAKKLPNREKWISKLPLSKVDSGRILEEDRT